MSRNTFPSTGQQPVHSSIIMPAPTTETIALVTGANKGIGRATAISLARDHGYTVLIGSRNPAAGAAVADELVSQGHKAVSVQLDLLSDESIANAVEFIDQTYGRLDVLINNAAVFLDRWKEDMTRLPTRELYDRTLATNVVGPACLTEALVPLLRKAVGGPRVVFLSTNMSSLANITNKELPYYHLKADAYDVSKTAVNMLALQYVRSLDDVGGRVNIACPGLVNTDMTRHAYPGAFTPEQGAAHVVGLATEAKGKKSGTFTSAMSPDEIVPW